MFLGFLGSTGQISNWWRKKYTYKESQKLLNLLGEPNLQGPVNLIHVFTCFFPRKSITRTGKSSEFWVSWRGIIPSQAVASDLLNFPLILPHRHGDYYGSLANPALPVTGLGCGHTYAIAGEWKPPAGV